MSFAISASIAILLGMAPPTLPVEAPEHTLKAEFIQRFTLFVEWPESAWQDDEEPFVVGVIGEDPFGETLDSRFEGYQVEGHPTIVRRVRGSDSLESCHLLYIAPDAIEDLVPILAQTAARPILTVADTEGAAHEGVQINLLVVDGRLRFEVNESAVSESGLGVSPKLLRLARRVIGQRP